MPKKVAPKVVLRFASYILERGEKKGEEKEKGRETEAGGETKREGPPGTTFRFDLALHCRRQASGREVRARGLQCDLQYKYERSRRGQPPVHRMAFEFVSHPKSTLFNSRALIEIGTWATWSPFQKKKKKPGAFFSQRRHGEPPSRLDGS